MNRPNCGPSRPTSGQQSQYRRSESGHSLSTSGDYEPPRYQYSGNSGHQRQYSATEWKTSGGMDSTGHSRSNSDNPCKTSTDLVIRTKATTDSDSNSKPYTRPDPRLERSHFESKAQKKRINLEYYYSRHRKNEDRLDSLEKPVSDTSLLGRIESINEYYKKTCDAIPSQSNPRKIYASKNVKKWLTKVKTPTALTKQVKIATITKPVENQPSLNPKNPVTAQIIAAPKPGKAATLTKPIETRPKTPIVTKEVIAAAVSSQVQAASITKPDETDQGSNVTSQTQRSFDKPVAGNVRTLKKKKKKKKWKLGPHPHFGEPGGRDDPRRRGLSGTGVRWYLRFLHEGMSPDDARKAAIERKKINPNKQKNNETIPAGDVIEISDSIHIGIFAKDFYANNLNQADLSSLEEAIVEEMMIGCEHKLMFGGIRANRGVLIVDCESKETADWLLKKAGELSKWKGIPLAAALESEIPKTYNIQLIIPNCVELDPSKIIALIEAQNEGVNTTLWTLLNCNDDNESQILDLVIDHESCQAIQKNGNKIHYRFGKLPVYGLEYLKVQPIKIEPEEDCTVKIEKDVEIDDSVVNKTVDNEDESSSTSFTA